MDKKVYDSKKLYSRKYNKSNSTVQIDRDLYNQLKESLKDRNISIRDFISNLIKNELTNKTNT